MNLQVDGFEIDADALFSALYHPSHTVRHTTSYGVAHIVKLNLDPDSTKRFEDYQRENDPCREEE